MSDAHGTPQVPGWPEATWSDPGAGWQEARYVALGVDVGSVSTQAVLLADGRLMAFASRRTSYDGPKSARRALDAALEAAGDLPEQRIDACVGTGYGRANVPFADRSVTEIACHARGAHFLCGPRVRTVLDVGGQDIKAIRCDEKGKVIDFRMNDKCAAGTGRGLEVFADLLQVPVADIGGMSLNPAVGEVPPVTETCVVYARAEAAGLLGRGWPKPAVLAAYCRAATERIAELAGRLGVAPQLAFTGGVAKNQGVAERLTGILGIRPLPASHDPQIAGALGAALFADALCRRGRGRRR